MNNFIFTSESVCSGHPDKICDKISDSILDSVLEQDSLGRVAVETLVTFDRIVLAGELTTKAQIDVESVAREQIRKLGYTDKNYGFWFGSPLDVLVHTQSPEIARGVNKKGAGDQGMMFGFACKDTDELMPLPIILAHRLAEKIDQLRETGKLKYLLPDGKTQITVKYVNGQPIGIEKVVVAVPHLESTNRGQVFEDIYNHAVKLILEKYGFEVDRKNVVLNGTGVWHQGGPAADTGLTGRKIVVDTYGGFARVGGGCFSGKDPTKVDRSGAYAARYIAKNVVAHGLADKCEISLAYVIGKRRPVMIEVETFGTEKSSIRIIRDFGFKLLDPAVDVILNKLDLRKPIYAKTAAYGHFGRKGFSWEEIDVDV